MSGDIEIFYDTCYKIPRKYEEEEFYKKVKSSLTRVNKGFGNDESTTMEFYIESDEYLYIPRYYPIDIFTKKQPQNKNIETEIQLKFIGKPRNKLQEHAINYLINNPKCIFQLEPGGGKTVISIAVMCHFGVRTIILTHLSSLIDQWKERILQFTNAIPDDIGILKSSNYDKILLNKSVILATTQTIMHLIRKDLQNFEACMLESGIGLFIGDEVHTAVGAPEFSKSSLLIPAKKVIGLSATPQRKIGYGILKQHLGEVYTCDQFNVDTMAPKIIVCLFDFKIYIDSRMRYLNWGGQFQYARYYNMYKKSKPFFHVITDVIDLCLERDRNIVVMNERIKIIDILFNHYCEKTECAKFTGGVSNSVLTKKLVFTTPGKMRDGVDAPWKDAMILTSNISNITQAIGRVVRPLPNKKQPIVFDFVDIKPPKIRIPFWKNRYSYYQEKGWEVLFYKYEIINGQAYRKQINEIEARSMV